MVICCACLLRKWAAATLSFYNNWGEDDIEYTIVQDVHNVRISQIPPLNSTSEVKFHYQSGAAAAIVCRHFLIWLMNTSGFIGVLLHSHLWMDMTIASVKKYS